MKMARLPLSIKVGNGASPRSTPTPLLHMRDHDEAHSSGFTEIISISQQPNSGHDRSEAITPLEGGQNGVPDQNHPQPPLPRRASRALARVSKKRRETKQAGQRVNEGNSAEFTTHTLASIPRSRLEKEAFRRVLWVRDCGLTWPQTLAAVRAEIDAIPGDEITACMVPTEVYDSVEVDPMDELRNSRFTGLAASDHVITLTATYNEVRNCDVDGTTKSQSLSLARIRDIQSLVDGAVPGSDAELSLAAQFALSQFVAFTCRLLDVGLTTGPTLRRLIANAELVAMLDPLKLRKDTTMLVAHGAINEDGERTFAFPLINARSRANPLCS